MREVVCLVRRRTYMTLIGQGKGRTRLQQVMGLVRRARL